MPGGVTRHVDPLERDPGDLDLVATGHRVRRIVTRHAIPAAGLAGAKRLGLARRRPHVDAGAFRERRDARDVVDVGVRDEDAGGARAHAGELETQ